MDSNAIIRASSSDAWVLVTRPSPHGALADLLLVDGDPLVNVDLLGDPAKNFVVIMKNGEVYKNLVR